MGKLIKSTLRLNNLRKKKEFQSALTCKLRGPDLFDTWFVNVESCGLALCNLELNGLISLTLLIRCLDSICWKVLKFFPHGA